MGKKKKDSVSEQTIELIKDTIKSERKKEEFSKKFNVLIINKMKEWMN